MQTRSSSKCPLKTSKYLRRLCGGANASIISLTSAQNPVMNFYLTIHLQCSPEDLKIVFSHQQISLGEHVQLRSADSRKAQSQA